MLPFLSWVLSAGGQALIAVIIFGGGYFIVAYLYFAFAELAERVARRQRAQRILDAEWDHFNTGL